MALFDKEGFMKAGKGRHDTGFGLSMPARGWLYFLTQNVCKE
jgi:hypothetical protein